MASLVVTIFLLSLVTVGGMSAKFSGRGADKTLLKDAAGADVVRAVLSRLDNLTESFFSQNERQVYEEFIREAAYVESLDGVTYPQDNRDGGIWRINRNIFQQTQSYNYPELFDEICRLFCIDWPSVDYSDLRIPLYSGLAIQIYLFHLRDRGLTLQAYALDEDRALFWVRYFGEHGTISLWLTRVQKLKTFEVCRVNTDVMFVIDSSGSIGTADYQTVRKYVHNFTSGLLSGNTDSRVGLIVYSDTATVDIPLDFVSANGKTALLNQIKNLRYEGGSTNTPQALCLLKGVGWRGSVSVLRSAVVLTDGLSNEYSSSCRTSAGQPGTLSSTAEEVHSLDPPVTVFAVGVADYNLDELRNIATSPNLVDTLSSFDYRLLLNNQQSLTYFICYKRSQPVITGEEQMGAVSMGSVSRLTFSAPGDEGVTVRICVVLGAITVYGSYTISNPSAAFHDFSEVLSAGEDETEICFTTLATIDDIGVNVHEGSCTLCSHDATNKKRTGMFKDSAGEQTVMVHIAIEGRSESESQFSVNSSIGSAFECAGDFCGENAVLVHVNSSCSCKCVHGYKGDGHECIVIPSNKNFIVAITILIIGVCCLCILLLGICCLKRKRIKYTRIYNVISISR